MIRFRTRKLDHKVSRIITFFTVLILVPVFTYIVIQIAKGYRPDLTTRTLRPTGLLVAKSTPKDARIYVDGNLVGETDTTTNLDPGSYSVEIKKDNFFPWKKTLSIEKELVTQTDVLLFPTELNPSNVKTLASNFAAISPDQGRFVFTVSPLASISATPTRALTTPTISPTPRPNQAGIYSLDLSDSPLNLNKDPRLISPVISELPWHLAQIDWSPDSRQILARLPRDPRCTELDRLPNPCPLLGAYLLDPSRTNNQPVNVVSTYRELLISWESELKLRDEIALSKIPKILTPLLLPHIKDIQLAPDDSKMLYIATASATIPDEVIPPVPAANSQPQERNIRPGFVYIYDIKEDRNFLIGPAPLPTPTPTRTRRVTPTLIPVSEVVYKWFPSSRHIFAIKDNQISIMEYDSTNQINIFSGDFKNTQVYATSSGHKIFLLLDHDQNPSTPSQLTQLTLKP